MTCEESYYLLLSLKNIIDNEFSPFVPEVVYVPESVTQTIDWLSYFKLDTFSVDYVTANAANLKAWLNNYVNYLSFFNNSTVWARFKQFPDILGYYFSLPLVSLLPYSEMSITAFNATTMTGQIYIISYRPYSYAGTSPSLYWELRKRTAGTVLCHVLYDSNSNKFNAVNQFIDKVALGNYYSGSSAYAYESDAAIRFVNV